MSNMLIESRLLVISLYSTQFFSIFVFFSSNYMYWKYINKIDFKAFLYTVFWIHINFVCFILGCNLG